MFSFDKLCNTLENLSSADRMILLTDKTVSVIEGLEKLGFSDGEIFDTLAAYVIGSIAVDNGLDEKEYLRIYPSLVKTFGKDFDFQSIKNLFKEVKNINKTITEYTKQMMKFFSLADEELQENIVMLCLLLVSIDGHVSLKEKHYIKKLCK